MMRSFDPGPAFIRSAFVLGLLAGTPALAFQVQTVTPIAPSLSLASPPGSGFGWMPGYGGAGFGTSAFAAPAPQQPDRRWFGFESGEVTRFGPFMQSVSRDFGFSGFDRGFSRFGGPNGLSFSNWTRVTTGYMASENLMFYTSVATPQPTRDRYSELGASAGFNLSQELRPQRDMRAGMQMNVAPGVTFRLEAGVVQP